MDLQRLATEQLGLLAPIQSAQQVAEICQRVCYARVIRAQCALLDAQRLPKQRFGLHDPAFRV